MNIQRIAAVSERPAAAATKVLDFHGLLRLTFAVLGLSFAAGCMTRVPANVQREANLEYARVGSQSLTLDIYTPANGPAKLPVLIWIHGGSWKSGSKDFCPIAFMATQNVAIVSINYRLSSVASFPAPLYDCKGAVRWLRANAEKYHLDPGHIGIFGASAGGHLAALLGTTAGVASLEGDVGGNLNYSSRVQAVCAFYPPTDLDKLVTDEKLRHNPRTDVGKFLGGALADNLDKAAQANPIHYISKETAPFFILHGEQDTLVPVEQSRLLYDALKRAGVEAQLEVVPGGHGIIAPPKPAEEIYQFFQTHLGIPRNPA
jgi:acetyl esterase/lipase